MNPIVIDSNMWILACATNQEDSDLDQQAAKHARHGDTDKIRGLKAATNKTTKTPKNLKKF